MTVGGPSTVTPLPRVTALSPASETAVTSVYTPQHRNQHGENNITQSLPFPRHCFLPAWFATLSISAMIAARSPTYRADSGPMASGCRMGLKPASNS